MAQLQQFSVVRTNKTLTISGLVFDENGVQVADFTGANALVFPQVVSTLTDEQIVELGRMLGVWILLQLAGLPNG